MDLQLHEIEKYKISNYINEIEQLDPHYCIKYFIKNGNILYMYDQRDWSTFVYALKTDHYFI